MKTDPFRARTEKLLAQADVVIGGGRPWDLQVHDERLYARIFAKGELGLGESYMDGWWDCERLDELIHRALRADLRSRIRGATRCACSGPSWLTCRSPHAPSTSAGTTTTSATTCSAICWTGG